MLSRREMMKNTALAVGVAATNSVGSWCICDESRVPQKKILLIGGNPDHPPMTHLYMKECELLAKCLRQTPGVQTVVSNGWPKDKAMLENLAAIALYSNPGAEHLFAPDHAAHAESLLKNGVGLAALHWGTGVANSNNTDLVERYIDCIGGAFGAWSRFVFSPSRVKQLDASHPICRGWSDFDLNDEWYLNMRLKSDVKPLAQVRYEDQDQVVLWTYERKDSQGGRSFANTLGHFHDNFKLESLRKSMINGILWAAHCDIPENGTPCAVTEDDLKVQRP